MGYSIMGSEKSDFAQWEFDLRIGKSVIAEWLFHHEKRTIWNKTVDYFIMKSKELDIAQLVICYQKSNIANMML